MPADPAKKIKTPDKGKTLIRMYRQGLGDCFLITFRGDDDQPVHMLIDCGVWDGDEPTVKKMKKAVENIRDATGGHIHLLICTHEHWDHNSGFFQQRKLFEEEIKIDRVWLAWTEDTRDDLARELKSEYEARRNKLAVAAQQLAATNKEFGERVVALIGTDGGGAAGMAAAGGVKADPAGAMAWVRDRGKPNSIDFLKPGDVRDIPGAKNSARAFVLGPPHSREMLRKNLPTKKQTEEGEVYHVAAGDPFHLRNANRRADEAFFAAVDQIDKEPEQIAALVGEELEQYQRGLPFDVNFQIPQRTARRGGRISEDYFVDQNKWRRIDNDWLSTAANIALWMDSSTNNTSLVLAIELLPARKVLLMAADAQTGNWMSWQDVKFNGDHSNVTVDDLLQRTVLYKVGHHGSHNATMRKHGLEKMTSDELVAMIPVNRKSVEAKGWAMPFPPMHRALRKATKGRVIRADEGVSNAPANFKFDQDDIYFQYACAHSG